MTVWITHETKCIQISTHILTKRMTQIEQNKVIIITDFNSHPHEEDDMSNVSSPFGRLVFQLTSSRRGWRRNNRRLFYRKYISTHILTKRMTLRRNTKELVPMYFNSHPHEEDDVIDIANSLETIYFNSHPHEEDDDIFFSFFFCIIISTHILTKRMTSLPFICVIENWIFQLTSSRRGWLFLWHVWSWQSCISTHILTKRMTKLTE